MKTVEERKFRKYRYDGVVFCDKCGSKIPSGEWHFSRSKYEILRERASSLFPCPLKRIIKQENLCKDCVPKDKIVKRDR